jgi:hypothetical protein
VSDKQSIPSTIWFQSAGLAHERGGISRPEAEQIQAWLEEDAASADALSSKLHEAITTGDAIDLSPTDRVVLHSALRSAQTDRLAMLRSTLESLNRAEAEDDAG